MARKLSTIARWTGFVLTVGSTSLIAVTASAQSETPTAESATVIDNPFTSDQPEPQTAVEPPQKLNRRPTAYQNPFAAASKLPPADTSLRPGPISRWRRPTIPGEGSSSIKSAMLSAPAAAPARQAWDQLPTAEALRNHAAVARGQETDPTFFARLTPSPNTIQFMPKPLTQPESLSEIDKGALGQSTLNHVDTAVLHSSLNTPDFANQTSSQSPVSTLQPSKQISRAFSLDTVDASPTKTDVSMSIITNCVETPAGWLEQAHHAAKTANSVEELSSIVEFCDRGLRSGPDENQSSSLRRLSAWAHNRRGELLADAEQGDDALHDFQAAISLDATCSLAIHNRAVTLAQQNQFDAALRDFNRVIELNPGLAVAYRNRAELLAALGRMEEAIGDYNKALESLPNDSQLCRDRAYAYQQLGEFAKASADLNRAIELSPHDPDALTQRGNLAAEQGNYEAARADFYDALTKNPNWAEAHRSLGWLRATCPDPKFQDANGAVSAAEWAAKLAPPNDYLILDTLAAAYASAGNFEKAKKTQQQSLANAPPDAVASLEQRLALYSHGEVFRNKSAPGLDHGAPDEPRAVSDAASDPSR